MYKLRQPQTEDEFKCYFHFRWRLLRAPWNQAEGSEQDGIEDQCYHIMTLKYNEKNDEKYNESDDEVIAVARLQTNSKTVAQIRYMAVAEEHQRKDIGKSIILHLEEICKQRSIPQVILDSRELAVDFYLKLGYTVTEKSYLLFDEIQHYRMTKTL